MNHVTEGLARLTEGVAMGIHASFTFDIGCDEWNWADSPTSRDSLYCRTQLQKDLNTNVLKCKTLIHDAWNAMKINCWIPRNSPCAVVKALGKDLSVRSRRNIQPRCSKSKRHSTIFPSNWATSRVTFFSWQKGALMEPTQSCPILVGSSL